MLKKMILSLALVMMVAPAFAGVDATHDVESDKARIEDGKTHDGVDVKEAAVKKVELIDTRIKTLTTNDNESKALKKAADIVINVNGKSTTGRELINDLASISDRARRSGKMTPEKEEQLKVVTAFVAMLPSVHLDSNNGKAAYIKELSLIRSIFNEYTPTEAASHIDFMKSVLLIKDRNESIDYAVAKKVLKQCNGNQECADKKLKEITDCKS